MRAIKIDCNEYNLNPNGAKTTAAKLKTDIKKHKQPDWVFFL